MEHQPSYYSILPAVVRYSDSLSDFQKIIFSEITALSNKDGYCTAGNEYFAKLYKKEEETISRAISKLAKVGAVKVFIDKQAGNKRKIYPSDQNTLLTNLSIAIDKNVNTPIDKNVNIIIQDYNNKDIVDFEQIDGVPSDSLLISSYHVMQTKDETEKEKNTLPGDVLAYLNEKAGTAYRASAKAHVTLINARAKEGYTLDDFKAVIDTKCAEWLKDVKMRKFLRPSTLFNATHFPEYLNQKQIDASAANQHEGQNEVTPHDEKYNAYLSWCKRNTPAIIDNVKHLSKAQYIQFVERTFHAQAKEFSGEFNSRRLTKAHNEMNAHAADMEKYKDVWTKFLADYDSFMKKATMQ